MKISNIINVIDVESTCWEPPESKPENEIQEIIEIGIAQVDLSKLEMVANESILVKPCMSKVSNFCTQLTTLTQEQVNAGVSFEEACQILTSKYKSKKSTFVSWGDFDRNLFKKECDMLPIEYPFGPRHLNLKNLFALLHGLPKELGMDAALQHLNIPLEGTHHRGDADAKNIAKIFIHTLKKFRG